MKLPNKLFDFLVTLWSPYIFKKLHLLNAQILYIFPYFYSYKQNKRMNSSNIKTNASLWHLKKKYTCKNLFVLRIFHLYYKFTVLSSIEICYEKLSNNWIFIKCNPFFLFYNFLALNNTEIGNIFAFLALLLISPSICIVTLSVCSTIFSITNPAFAKALT